MITLLRCDDRLIHGQCMNLIVKRYDIKEIIVVDDYTASNSFLKRIFEAAVPKDMKATPLTLAEAKPAIEAAKQNNTATLVLMRSPYTMLLLYEQIADLPMDFNIASVISKTSKYDITKYAHLNEEELAAVKKMDEMGVHLWFNLIPDQPTTEWSAVKSKY